jgi:hypothetical protein
MFAKIFLLIITCVSLTLAHAQTTTTSRPDGWDNEVGALGGSSTIVTYTSEPTIFGTEKCVLVS